MFFFKLDSKFKSIHLSNQKNGFYFIFESLIAQKLTRKKGKLELS